jgi:hypothetical protein
MKRFQKGDRVFDIRYGWGTVTMFDGDYDVAIRFDNDTCDHYFNGRGVGTISFTEYTLEGFSSERPEPSWIDIYQEWYDSNGDILLNSFLEYLEKNFEIPVRKCK